MGSRRRSRKRSKFSKDVIIASVSGAANGAANGFAAKVAEKIFGFGKKSVSRKRSKLVKGTRVTYWKSSSKNKKWMTITPSGRKVHWGDPHMKDYTQHHNKKRRSNYKSRHAGIRLKNGSRAIDKKWSPAWLSYNVTW